MSKLAEVFNDNIFVYEDKCENILPSFKSEFFDLIIIDPPYDIAIADWDKWLNITNVTKQLYRLLKHNGSMFVFTGWSSSINVINKTYKNFKLKDWIIYDRMKGRGTKKSLVSTREDLLWYVKNESNYIFHKEKAYSTIKKKTKGMGIKNGRDTRALSNVWTDISPIVPWSKEHNAHPTQKPVALIERIIDVFSNENSMILDCYAGSGTTGEACKNKNQGCVLIEKEPQYIKIIIERVK